ncbi:helix-turn-helix domain-containing protein [Pseudarthrobacter sulfonivorans]|uniref:helix-turn-helix domain-containing protein n=1 Tax=Pseudarthrobacter sulfonivorans TaxID=121292 RepID=UPI002855C2D0|nr:helix-turn-helix domain-containing protein [Pseudarthrobacter sulfonivorans]MDR6413501.1 hypothetical protein [Pseudarthrobacter sulfonivorans]
MSTVPRQKAQPLQYANAIAKSGLPSGVRATCWALATFADNYTGEAWPSVKTLAEAVGLSEAVVSKHTGTAESRGYLRKVRRTNTSILYTITVPTGEDVSIQSPAEEASEPPPWIKDIVDDIEAGRL